MMMFVDSHIGEIIIHDTKNVQSNSYLFITILFTKKKIFWRTDFLLYDLEANCNCVDKYIKAANFLSRLVNIIVEQDRI